MGWGWIWTSTLQVTDLATRVLCTLVRMSIMWERYLVILRTCCCLLGLRSHSVCLLATGSNLYWYAPQASQSICIAVVITQSDYTCPRHFISLYNIYLTFAWLTLNLWIPDFKEVLASVCSMTWYRIIYAGNTESTSIYSFGIIASLKIL
jgi:hypothetical protein